MRDAVVFEEGDPAKPEFYVVVKGEVAVTQRVDGETVLMDVCDDGVNKGTGPGFCAIDCSAFVP